MQKRACLLSVNVGSTSVRYALYDVKDGVLQRLPRMRGHRQQLEGVRDFTQALDDLRTDIGAQIQRHGLLAVAHRVVHGGAEVHAPTQATALVMRHLEACEPMAPLHQPFNLMGVRLCQETWPAVPQIVCPDTAFHTALPDVERCFALPENLRQQGYHRYGFHGLSCESALQTLERQGADTQGRLVVAHLGGGCSVTALRYGKPLATSMGFSTLDGLVMSTRSGAIDPGVLLCLMDHGWTRQQLQDLLYLDSGLKGLSGMSGDLRVLRAHATQAAQLAIGVYVHRLVREIGGLVACLGGLDLLVFTGGVGEGDARLRAEVADRLAWLNVRMDGVLNDAAALSPVVSAQALHAPGSTVGLYAVVADEALIAAQHALRCLQ